MLNTNNFTALFSFGDSISDPGNTFALTTAQTFGLFPVPPSPPYFLGRFSNGPVATEYLATALGFTLNPFYDDGTGNAFAVGGAQTGSGNSIIDDFQPFFPNIDLPGLADQVDDFEKSLGAQAADPNGLYTVWAGPNDFLDYLAGSNVADPAVLLEDGVTNVVDAVTRLSSLGAESLVVPNMTLGRLPFSANFQPEATAISLAFNAGLTLALGNLTLGTNPIDASVIEVDLFSVGEQVAADPAKFGFTDVKNPLLLTGLPLNTEGFFFWDLFHPTTQGHQVFANAILDTIKGEIPQPSFNQILGTAKSELLLGSQQDDNIDGLGGNDLVLGRSGNDRIEGWQGKDRLFGGQGDDILAGGEDNDTLEGGSGNDILFGNAGNDFMFGNQGQDILIGAQGKDNLWGASGDDYLLGGGEDDKIFGGRGQDILNGGSGKDNLVGDQGEDQLDGGAGNDQLQGGGSSDVFAFRPGSGKDRVSDFQPGEDRINLLSFKFGNFEKFTGAVNRSGTVLDFGGGDTLQLLGTDVTVLTAADFIFA